MSNDSPKNVIGIIAASHCKLAEEMVRVAELIVGPLQACEAISFQPEQSVEEMTRELRETVKRIDQGKGVLILTDLFGGTPANVSFALLGPGVEVVCGMNLPMMIKLAACRGELSLQEAAAVVKEYGQRHISLASEVLSRSVRAQ